MTKSYSLWSRRAHPMVDASPRSSTAGPRPSPPPSTCRPPASAQCPERSSTNWCTPWASSTPTRGWTETSMWRWRRTTLSEGYPTSSTNAAARVRTTATHTAPSTTAAPWCITPGTSSARMAKIPSVRLSVKNYYAKNEKDYFLMGHFWRWFFQSGN